MSQTLLHYHHIQYPSQLWQCINFYKWYPYVQCCHYFLSLLTAEYLSSLLGPKHLKFFCLLRQTYIQSNIYIWNPILSILFSHGYFSFTDKACLIWHCVSLIKFSTIFIRSRNNTVNDFFLKNHIWTKLLPSPLRNWLCDLRISLLPQGGLLSYCSTSFTTLLLAVLLFCLSHNNNLSIRVNNAHDSD